MAPPESPARHRVVVLGGGAAGITVAARLRRAGFAGVTVVDPAVTHYYQPLWTLVGGGRAPVERTARPQASVMPRGVVWRRQAAVAVDPDAHEVTLDEGDTLGYDQLVVCPGIQLDWDRLPGARAAVGRDGVSSNYAYELAPAMWRFIRDLRSGTAVFTAPSGPIKCGGAPQKIAYLAADHWRREGVLDRIEMHLVLPGDRLFGVPEFERVLAEVVRRYGIVVHLGSEVTALAPDAREVRVTRVDGGAETTLGYDLVHVTPPQSAPDWIAKSPLADPADPHGYVEVDPHTLRHTRHPDVWALGDVANLPTGKTGAAVRKQAPVLVRNLRDALAGRPPSARYDGYSSCPFVTSRHTALLAEFDYDLRPVPSIPLIDTARERRDMYLLKRYGLPALYWNLMLRGLV